MRPAGELRESLRALGSQRTTRRPYSRLGMAAAIGFVVLVIGVYAALYRPFVLALAAGIVVLVLAGALYVLRR